ncbi:two-component regulator propeller domain-containing protein [Mucilaginibacter arboris]|uniref:histidine kinase n=1 Tax=Mucilaginibacter arboris TaxID=2682090 RepID=A0A7K1SSH7_9SPHI|nr:two-component regulator propeller domain-containing protein [Mucilaginibacter arboris]MVN20262.1 response regulator [Mucilaginibacter arboris]
MASARDCFFKKNICVSIFTLLLLQFFLLKKARANEVPVQFLGIEKGLSNNNVTCIFKDHYGFMWFGTFQGLNRYDGYDFKVFKNKLDDTTSLANNYVSAIAEDGNNNIWVGTQRGISIYSNLTANFSSLYYRPYRAAVNLKVTSYINSVKPDAKGDLFIATRETGLLICKKGSNKAFQVPLRNTFHLNLQYNVQAITIIGDKIWLFIKDKGLYRYNSKTGGLNLINAAINKANCMEADNQGTLWIGTNNGIYRYSISTNTYQHYTEQASKLSGSVVTSFCIDKNSIWIGTDGGGITILNTTTGKICYMLPGNDKNALNSGAIYTIYQDQDLRKWIGTLRGGINIIDPKKNKFKLIEHNLLNKNSINNNFILSFCEDAGHNIWIGTDGAGLNYWDRRQRSFISMTHNLADPQSLSNNYVTYILQDYRNNIWVSTYGGGINKYKSGNHSFEHYTCYNSVSKHEDEDLWYLLEDQHKNLWAAAGFEGGLYQLNQQKNQFELFDANIKTIFSLAKDHSGQLWAGTFNSLVKVDTISKKHQVIKIAYPVRSIYEDEEHYLWLGTEGGGLLRFNPQNNQIEHVTEANGLASNSILNILEDKSHNLWLSTYNGISKYNVITKKISNFFDSDGLQSNQFNYNAAIKLQSGEFLFGGIKGFNIFYPDSIKPDIRAPEVFLTGFKINNVPLEQDASFTGKKSVLGLNSITIPYDKAVLSVDFAAPEYSYPDKINYAYFLQGWDKTWNEVGKLRTANYSRLTEGNYILRVRATNTSAGWSPKERVIHIQVLPPWYRTWWAYVLYFCAAAGAVYYYLRYQKKQFRLEQEVEITHIKAEKERELNEKRLSFFTNISHEFRTPLTLIINPVKDLLNTKGKDADTADLNIVYRNAKRLLSLVDQLLLFRKAESETDKLKVIELNFFELCKEIYLCFAHQAKKHHILYELKCENEWIKVYADREKLEIILFNLISNALKFTPDGGTITVQIKEDEKNVFLAVKDSGCGITASAEQKLFDKFYQAPHKSPLKNGFGIGLFLVKSFVESHKGKISYQTEIGKGTEFLISLPKGTLHFAPELIFENDTKHYSILEELINVDVFAEEALTDKKAQNLEVLISDQQSILIVDDDQQIREYITRLFEQHYKVYTAENAEDGFKLIKEKVPNLIISDVLMNGESGIALCNRIKADDHLSHIPVILLTASSSSEIKLKGLEEGADDYISKPFEKELLVARVTNLLKSRDNLQKYFYNEVTLRFNNLKISEEYKSFLNRCIAIVEKHLTNPDFSIKTLASEIGMSHSNLYKKVKSISGQSVNAFIRFIRLRKAAGLLIDTDLNVNEVAFQVGFNDLKYFREQFNKLFGVNPSEYIKKHRVCFHKNYSLHEKASKARV